MMLTIGPALIRRLETNLLPHVCGPVGLLTLRTQVETASNHVGCETHEFVDCVIDGLDTVRVVHGKLGVVGCLDALANDSIAYTKCIEDKLRTICGSIGNQLILFVEVIIE